MLGTKARRAKACAEATQGSGVYPHYQLSLRKATHFSQPVAVVKALGCANQSSQLLFSIGDPFNPAWVNWLLL